MIILFLAACWLPVIIYINIIYLCLNDMFKEHSKTKGLGNVVGKTGEMGKLDYVAEETRNVSKMGQA